MNSTNAPAPKLKTKNSKLKTTLIAITLCSCATPRIDTSEQVWFANDQMAIRFIEEIDFDYAATDATSALLTPRT